MDNLAFTVLTGNPQNYDEIEKEKKEDRTNFVEEIKRLYEELDETIGHLGWYQGLIVFAIFLSKVAYAMNGSLPVFTAARPDFRCKTCFDDDSTNYYNFTESQIQSGFFNVDESQKTCSGQNPQIDSCSTAQGVGWGETNNHTVCCYIFFSERNK